VSRLFSCAVRHPLDRAHNTLQAVAKSEVRLKDSAPQNLPDEDLYARYAGGSEPREPEGSCRRAQNCRRNEESRHQRCDLVNSRGEVASPQPYAFKAVQGGSRCR
jgi:hypothetical protein